MIGHDDKFIQRRIRSKNRRIEPFGFGELAKRIEIHLALNDCAKKVGSVYRAKSYKVATLLGIIIFL